MCDNIIIDITDIDKNNVMEKMNKKIADSIELMYPDVDLNDELYINSVNKL